MKKKKARKVRKLKKIKKPKKVKKVRKPKKVKKIKRVKKIKKAKKVMIVTKPALKVPYTQENAMQCICTKCPIQAESMCVKEKMEKMQAMMQAGASTGTMPSPADLPGLYCSTGVATCGDLDLSKMCMCMGCQVWAKYKLDGGKPMGYFCRDGKAE